MMQCLEGMENGKGTFMAWGVWLMISQETQIRGRSAIWEVSLEQFSR